ncbi:signal peptidase I [Sporosalibacterium faouarense]|uniref:signal peptidase I n=1 Tax=Sporosalibacterium faouarense TaxID=516123 RepID=UPI00141C66A2|nr:signal peptidase I [Sporosalibacterium faouarense]MTI47484.1 signal peptidase I [Bacillota bacterium]
MDIYFFEVIVLLTLALLSDICTYKISNKIVYPFICIGIITNTLFNGIEGFKESLIGVIVPLVLLLILFAFRMLGAGDIKLFSAIGSIMGGNFILFAIAYSFIFGGIISFLLIILRKNGVSRIKYLLNYLKNSFLTLKAFPYENFADKSNKSKFHFSYGIVCGTLFKIYQINILNTDLGGRIMSSSIKQEIFSWAKTIIIAFIIAFLLKTFIFRPVYVVGASMEPTLSNGQVLIMWKLDYKLGEPDRGDIVIIKKNQDKLDHKSLIKRVIGLPGETVEIKKGKVYIDGEELSPDYVDVNTPANGFGKMQIPENMYFVMGDNRNNSRDSRDVTVGFISRENIEGKATVRLWPFNELSTLK